MKTICLDLDGTLFDVSRRFYGMYSEFVLEHRLSPISKSFYLRCLRSGVRNYDVFGRFHNISIYDEFIRFRNQRIEQCDYLQSDVLVPGIRDLLSRLSRDSKLVLISGRNIQKNMEWQLKQNKILQYFDSTHTSGLFTGAKGKLKFLKNKKVEFVIGDTEIDIETGNALRAKTIVVTWGLRNRTYLNRRFPDFIVSSPKQLLCTVSSFCNRFP